MPKNYLLRRGSRYYFRIKVPVDLREAMGKMEIKYSLGTSDFRLASQKVKVEALKAEAEFQKLRRQKMKPVSNAAGKPKVGEAEALSLVANWYAGLEQASEDWLEKNLDIFQRPDELQEAIQTAEVDEFVLSGGGPVGEVTYPAANGRRAFEQILEERGMEFGGSSEEMGRLGGVVRRCLLENTRRDLCRLQRLELPGTGEIYSLVGASNPGLTPSPRNQVPTAKSGTVGELLDLFMDEQRKAGRAEATLRTYRVPVRLLREVLGEKEPLALIDRSRIAKLRDLILSLPANARTRYRDSTLLEAIKKARKDEVPSIEVTTAANYFNCIHAIFGFAVEIGMIDSNPASDRWLRRSFRGKGKSKRLPFSEESLERVFMAILNPEERRTHKIHRKSGKFWVPFLGLFHGFRLNEACQIHTEDVVRSEGVLCIHIRAERADGSDCEKRLKNPGSKRLVPVHPALLKMGFAAFVRRRRKDKSKPLLFPDLTLGRNGYYSDPFQKWFKRFLQSVLGKTTALSFHSFRHTWRDALRVARVSDDIVGSLGGWTGHQDVQHQYGEGYPVAVLLDDLSKVRFPTVERHIKQPRKGR